MKTITALGLMSGTSMDGLDMATAAFHEQDGKWAYTILQAETIEYPSEWKERLSNLHLSTAVDFWKTHIDYGHYLGQRVNDFISSTGLKPELVCSHGHTIFHQPEKGFTMQAGAGEAIAAVTALPVISDFRAADLALGGQGAPLVPIGDKLLFGEYDACLNIGGFSNISFDKRGQRIAFDICPANGVLNILAGQLGYPFDKDGKLARTGKLDKELFDKLNSLAYYRQEPPKSLGREWLETKFMPLISHTNIAVEDKLRTCCEHIGYQFAKSLEADKPSTVLVTGGGAKNSFLVETLEKYYSRKLTVPGPQLIDYKEALVFAFLGVLRWYGKINILASVTGAGMDHSGGAVYDLFPSR